MVSWVMVVLLPLVLLPCCVGKCVKGADRSRRRPLLVLHARWWCCCCCAQLVPPALALQAPIPIVYT